jgi:hypothetical protein
LKEPSSSSGRSFAHHRRGAAARSGMLVKKDSVSVQSVFSRLI